MTHSRPPTSESLNSKAAELELLALHAVSPGQAGVYLRVAGANRRAAALAKLAEAVD